MRLRPTIVEAVLAAFIATTAVPGPGVVSHTHAGGDHEHAHDLVALEHHHHDEDDDDDDHDHEHHHLHFVHHDPADHALDLTEPDHDPLHHTHVSSPFQPGTRPAAPSVVVRLTVTMRPASRPRTRLDRSLPSIRSRGPPRSARS